MTLTADNLILTKKIFLKASHCGPQQDLPMPVLFSEIIDIATEHANELGIGYDHMMKFGAAWILGRVSLSITRLPQCNRSFTLSTWIMNMNRYFSERAIVITGEDGTEIGRATTVWMAIDIEGRHAARLDRIFPDGLPAADLPADTTPRQRMPKIDNPDKVTEHRFQFSDMDCNRHVTTTRYVEQFINLHDMDFYDTHRICSFDISFHAETLAGDTVTIEAQELGDGITRADIKRGDTLCTAATIQFTKR